MRPRARPPPAGNAAATTPATPPPVPWFMDEQVVETPIETVAPTSDELLPPIAWLPPYLPATSDIPEELARLIDMCITGSLSALVARPAAIDDIDIEDWSERVRGSPLTVIKPMDRAQTVGEQGQDWIVVVQVRGSGIGTVRRVATDLGAYLKRTVPPAPTQPEAITLDAILGPAQVLGDSPAPDTKREPRPTGMSRIEHEVGHALPAWQIQKIALARKYPDGWSPMTKLSHEAQEGLRLLHAADPVRFDITVLSRRFRISPESVRRILKSKWRPTQEEAQRKNERAKTAYAAKRGTSREDEEMASLREGIDMEIGPRSPAPAVDDQGYEHEVRFEGLVSSADLAEGRRRQKSISSRGSGDWCLIDAGWCVVHVMTADARERYRLEDLWRHNGTNLTHLA
ncbi:asparagine--tRNA ligase [Malassezia caprae]|uniref:Required for respiratory growth protein 9, mitochondrial n=1 Tax=Malassezia caprae TaxID=1381934 RepID=A0AAF0EA51_9BASI|nr:asparagine--tRNA ligase [Malassezia caprae]